MDYSKIKLENERNSHVTKRLNRLNTWKFFTVLYRDNIWRLFGFSILMILCMAPIFAVLILGSMNASTLQQGLPALNNFGFSTGTWEGLPDYVAGEIGKSNTFYGLMAVVASLLMTVMFSGGFAVIRDAFWTGKLSTVGVLKSIGKGIKANVLYALISTVFIAFSVYGIYQFYVWLSAQILWLAIVLTVLLSLLDMLAVMYLLTLCSVSVTYKQSVASNMDDSWRLMWLNFLPNIIHLVIGLIPIGLYFIFRSGLLQSLYMVLVLMFGGIYFPLVWQSHMMRTFALFHPVEVKKKSQVKKEQQAAEQQKLAERQAEEERLLLNADAPAANKKGKKKSKSTVAEEPIADLTAEIAEDEDPYAIEEDEAADVTEIAEENE